MGVGERVCGGDRGGDGLGVTKKKAPTHKCADAVGDSRNLSEEAYGQVTSQLAMTVLMS